MRVHIFLKKYCSFDEIINSLIVFEIFTEYLSSTGAKQLVHPYESVACTNLQIMAPFVPKSFVSYKDGIYNIKTI